MQKEINIRRNFNFQTIPATIGVYFFYAGDTVIYIGKSVNLKARIKTHFDNAKINQKEAAIINKATTLKYIITDSEIKALLLESKLIQRYKPRYNTIWKDDRSYLYIKITQEEYPKIYPVRKEQDQTADYFGPFSSQKQLNFILREIRKVFPFCSQKKISSRPCFYSKINLCSPCPNVIAHLKDKKLVRAYRQKYCRNITRIKDFLSGKDKKVIQSLYRDLKQLSNKEKYEEAMIMRNKIQIMENFLKQKINDIDYDQDYNQSYNNLKKLQELLLPYFGQLNLSRIEGYDISNLNQRERTAAMVVLTNGLVDKTQYRKFKIKTRRSDFSMLKEAISRRFKNNWPDPDLILVDGGRPQVKVVRDWLKAMRVKIPVVGLAKHPDRLVIGDAHLTQIKSTSGPVKFQLLQLLRDEAHRFARKYHLFLRSKKFLV
jgi:excinuclease ABC subunit C